METVWSGSHPVRCPPGRHHSSTGTRLPDEPDAAGHQPWVSTDPETRPSADLEPGRGRGFARGGAAAARAGRDGLRPVLLAPAPGLLQRLGPRQPQPRSHGHGSGWTRPRRFVKGSALVPAQQGSSLNREPGARCPAPRGCVLPGATGTLLGGWGQTGGPIPPWGERGRGVAPRERTRRREHRPAGRPASPEPSPGERI